MSEMILPLLNECCIVASAICMAFGWRHIRKGRVEAHKRMMLISVWLAAAFFISYVLKTIIIGDTTFGGPRLWRIPYQTFLQIHSILATVAAILGIFSLRFAYKQRFASHKRLGPWTATTWFITAFSGVMVFLLLYVVFQPGPTTNIFRAWLGH